MDNLVRWSRKHQDRHIIDFSSNITPNGMPSSIKTALKKNLDQIEQYPDSHSHKLHSSLQKYLHVSKHNITVGNGAIEIIYNFCYAFLSKNTKVLIPVPTFQEYENASKLNDCKISYFETMNLSNVDEYADIRAGLQRMLCDRLDPESINREAFSDQAALRTAR